MSQLKLVPASAAETFKKLKEYKSTDLISFDISFGTKESFLISVELQSVRYLQDKGLFFCGFCKCVKRILSSFDLVNLKDYHTSILGLNTNPQQLSDWDVPEKTQLYIAIKRNFSTNGQHFIIPINDISVLDKVFLLSAQLVLEKE